MIIYDQEFVKHNFNGMHPYRILKSLSIPHIVDIVLKTDNIESWIREYLYVVGDVLKSIGHVDVDFELNDNTIVFVTTNPNLDKIAYCCVTRNIADQNDLIDQMISVSKMKAFI